MMGIDHALRIPPSLSVALVLWIGDECLCNQFKAEISPKTLKLVSQRYGISLSELLDDDSIPTVKQSPDVSGYIECEGKVVKVKSIDDLITITDNIKRMAENYGV